MEHLNNAVYLPNEIILRIADNSDFTATKSLSLTCRLLNKHCRRRLLQQIRVFVELDSLRNHVKQLCDANIVGLVSSIRLEPLPDAIENNAIEKPSTVTDDKERERLIAQDRSDIADAVSLLHSLLSTHRHNLRKLTISWNLHKDTPGYWPTRSAYVETLRTALSLFVPSLPPTVEATPLQHLVLEILDTTFIQQLLIDNNAGPIFNNQTNPCRIPHIKLLTSPETAGYSSGSVLSHIMGSHTKSFTLTNTGNVLGFGIDEISNVINLTSLKLHTIFTFGNLAGVLQTFTLLEELEIISLILLLIEGPTHDCAWSDIFDICCGGRLPRLRKVKLHCLHYYEHMCGVSKEVREGDVEALRRLRDHAVVNGMEYKLEEDGLYLDRCGSDDVAHKL